MLNKLVGAISRRLSLDRRFKRRSICRHALNRTPEIFWMFGMLLDLVRNSNLFGIG